MGKHSMKPGFKSILVSDMSNGQVFFHPYEWMGPTKDLVVRMRVPYAPGESGYIYEAVLSGCFLDAPEQIIQDLCRSIRWDEDPD